MSHTGRTHWRRLASASLTALSSANQCWARVLDGTPSSNPWSRDIAELGLAAVLILALGFLLGKYARRPRASQSQFKEILDVASDGVIICDRETQQILYTNLAIQRRLGYEEHEFLELSLTDLFSATGDSAASLLAGLSKGESEHPLHAQHRCKNGSLIDVEVHCNLIKKGGRVLTAFTTRDISVRKKAELQLLENQQRLSRIAHHDQLTGLPNRHYITTFLPEAIAAARAAGMLLGIVFIDLDRFKHINDTYGHETGDKLLKIVAERLRQCVRPDDVVVRMGGDEFVIILLNLSSEQEVTRISARIIADLATPIVVESRALQTSASLGISMFPRDGADMVELLKHSDTAMYQAKDGGRNNVQMFTPDMNRRLQQRVAVEAMLRDALRRRELDVFYQPLVNLISRRTIGLEALVRWRHPKHGMIPPDWFIPVAEETGLVIPIGNFVLHRVFQDLKKWRAAGATLVPVSLNIASSQLMRGDFQSKVTALLSSHELRPELLQLELTERSVFDIRRQADDERRQDTLGNLRDLGIKIAIDDFGTGYSSLAYLKHWQIDTLKIDKSFVRDLVTDASDLAIVSAIVAIARHLQIEVIAEGIEGYQQADILQNLGCHHGQGYLFGRPMSAEKCFARLVNAPIGEAEIPDMLDSLEMTGNSRMLP